MSCKQSLPSTVPQYYTGIESEENVAAALLVYLELVYC